MANNEFILAQADVGNAFPVDLISFKERLVGQDLFPHMEAGHFVGEKDWHVRSLLRHPELSVRLGQLSEQTRLSCFTREALERFYMIAEKALKGIDPKNVWVMNESGVAARGARIKVSPALCELRAYSLSYDAPISIAGIRTPWSALRRHSEVGDHKTHHARGLRVTSWQGGSPCTRL